MPFPCHAVPLMVYNVSVPFDLQSAAVSDPHLPCSDNAVLLKATARHGRREAAVLCCGLEKNGMIGAWHGHGHGMASVNQTRPHCVNQVGKTHYKTLAAWHGRGTAWLQHRHGMLCVNRTLGCFPERNGSQWNSLGGRDTRFQPGY